MSLVPLITGFSSLAQVAGELERRGTAKERAAGFPVRGWRERQAITVGGKTHHEGAGLATAGVAFPGRPASLAMLAIMAIMAILAILAIAPVSAAETQSAGSQAAGTPAARVMDIVLQASAVSYYQGANGKARVEMRIVDAQGRERTRDFTILRYDVANRDNGDQKFYVYFHAPADVSQSVFLAWKHIDKADDRWLYLPGLDLVKRISASDARTSFMGSHFYYEDVSGRLPTSDTHTLEAESGPYFVVASVPKDAQSVEFSRYRNWIHKSTYLPVKTEFLDVAGEVYRTYEALKVETIQGHPTVVEAKMSDRRIGGHTLLRYSGVAYDQDIEEDLFSERYLRNPPRKVLR